MATTSPLRQRMIEDMTIRNLSQDQIRASHRLPLCQRMAIGRRLPHPHRCCLTRRRDALKTRHPNPRPIGDPRRPEIASAKGATGPLDYTITSCDN
jgi:hypothetical protein